MPQLFASYLTDAVIQDLRNHFSEEETDRLFRQMSSFELISYSNLDHKSLVPDSIIAVASNLISRGQPTPAPILIEEFISSTIHLTKKGKNTEGKVCYLPKTLFQTKSQASRILINRSFGTNQQTIVETEDYPQALFLTHLPIAIAWLQKSILKFILTNKLNLKKKIWSIGVIEQDIPCAHLAIKHLKELVEHLFNLEGKNRLLPKIELIVFSTNTSTNNTLEKNRETVPLKNYKERKGVDLLLDLMVLPDTVPYEDYKILSKFNGKIRPSKEVSSPHFYFSEPVTYSNTTRNALIYFWEELFRDKNPSNLDIQIVSEGLLRKSLIAQRPYSQLFRNVLMPTLLQPAASIIFNCNFNLHFHWYKKTKKLGLSTAFPLYAGWKELSEHGALLGGIDVESSLQFDKKNELLQTGDQLKLAHLFLWEAQCCSLWSQQFQPGYELGTTNLKRIFNRSTNTSTVALTGSASLAELRDIKSSFEEKTTLFKQAIQSNDRFKISIVKPQTTAKNKIENDNSRDIEWGFKKAIGLNNQKTLVQLVQQIHQDKKSKTLVICPFETGYFGVDEFIELTKNPNHIPKSVSWTLQDSFKELNVGSFYFSPEQGQSEQRLQHNLKILQLWDQGEIDILVTSYSLFPEFPLSDVDQIIHFGLPNSLASIYKSTYGTLAGNHEIQHYYLYNNESTSQKQNVGKSIEKEHLYHFHKNKFKGREKEKLIICELLSEISFPSNLSADNELTKLIKTKTGINVRLNLIALRLYILDDNKEKTYGYIDLSNQEFNPVHFLQAEERQLSEQILEVTKAFIVEKRNTVNYFSKWIETYFRPAPILGLLPRLSDLAVGDTGTFEIGLVNNTIEKIQDIINNLFEGESVIYNIEIILQSEATLKISLEEDIFQKTIWKACQECFTPSYFIKKVNEYYKLELSKRDERKGVFYKDYIVNIQLPADHDSRIQIEQLLLQMRTSSDTFKALHTLVLLGIIEDYSLNYAQEKCTLYFQKKKKKYYLSRLNTFLKRHCSDNYAHSKLNELDQEIPFLEQIANQLIDFTYDFVEPKQALEIEKIIASAELDGEPYSSLLNMHFAPRYEHPRHLPNLSDDIEKHGLDINIVWKYLDLMHSERQDFSFVSNLEQLDETARNLLIKKPENPVLNLLVAFTNSYFSTRIKDDELQLEVDKFKPGIQQYVKGFISFKQLYNWNHEEFQKNIVLFNDKLINCRKPLEMAMTQATDWLFLEAQNQWLKAFSNQVTTEN